MWSRMKWTETWEKDKDGMKDETGKQTKTNHIIIINWRRRKKWNDPKEMRARIVSNAITWKFHLFPQKRRKQQQPNGIEFRQLPLNLSASSSPSEQQQQHEASTSSIWIWLKEEEDLSSSQVKGNVRHRVEVEIFEFSSFLLQVSANRSVFNLKIKRTRMTGVVVVANPQGCRAFPFFFLFLEQEQEKPKKGARTYNIST